MSDLEKRSSKKVVPNRYSTSAGDQELGSSAPLGNSSNFAEISEGPSEFKAHGQQLMIKQEILHIPDSMLSKSLSSCCSRFLLSSLLVVYIAGVVLSQFYLPEEWFWPLCVFYIPALMTILFDIIGRHVLSAIMYPYQNSILKESLDRMSNLRFGQEQARLFHSFVYTIKLKSGILEEGYDANRSASLRSISRKIKSDKKDSLYFTATECSEVDDGVDVLSFGEMQQFISLLETYIEANEKSISIGHKSRIFKIFAFKIIEILNAFRNQLKSL